MPKRKSDITSAFEDLLAQASPESHPVGDRVTVRELLDRASGQIDRSFADQPEVGASVRLAIGQKTETGTDFKLRILFAHRFDALQHVIQFLFARTTP